MYKSMFEMSIEEVNGKSSRRRKKSASPEPLWPEPSQVVSSQSVPSQVAPSQLALPRQGPPEPRVRLLHWKDMPRHLQFNPYVLTGYRPLQTSTQCFRSLFYFHNETINILTHGISIVYILLVVPALLPWEGGPRARLLSACHVLGALAPWCGSFLYHLFMNHASGEYVYQRLLQLDMLGIWVSQSIGAVPMVTATVYCSPAPLRLFVMGLYFIFCLIGLYKALRAGSPWSRRLCFALPFCSRVLLACARAAKLAGGDPHALLHVFLQDGVSVLGGVIGALHIPEKWCPGAVDRCLNSHNIMHVLVLVAVYSMHQATSGDLAWMLQTDCL